MDYLQELRQYQPQNEQEAADQRAILLFSQQVGNDVLQRHPVAHITSSGFVVNEARDKALLVHHNIRGVWGWTGGHADGDENLLRVALREAAEETGATGLQPLSPHIASLDILPVEAHHKNGAFVNRHLHLSVAYLLVCAETQPLRAKEGENTGVAWFPLCHFTTAHFSPADVALYQKLIERAQCLT